MKKNKIEKQAYKIGELNIESGRIDITDPCYDADTWCRINGLEVKPGKYDCYVSVLDGKDAETHGHRVVKMFIMHQDVDHSKELRAHLIGSVCVDAGLMSISEADTKPDYTNDEWDTICENLDELLDSNPFGYSAVVSDEVTPGENPKPQFWASSGFGDGEYNVVVADSSTSEHLSEIVPDFVCIEFIDDEDLSEEDYD